METLPPMVVLAAGRATRMGFPKVLAEVRGRPLLEVHVESWLAVGCECVVVVLGYLAEQVVRRADLSHAHVVVNEGFDLGQFSSVQVGVRALRDVRCSSQGMGGRVPGGFVTPADCPPVPADVVSRLWRGIQHAGGSAAAIPEFEGRGGHPILLGPGGVDRVLEAPSHDTLAGVLASLGKQAVKVPVDHPGILWNINTPEDLRRYLAGDSPGRGKSGDRLRGGADR